MRIRTRVSLLCLPLIACCMLLAPPGLFAQSCCTRPGPEAKSEMSMYMNASFVRAHEAPLPFKYIAMRGQMIRYAVSGGDSANAFYVPAKQPTSNYLVIVHEWWGLNDYIKQEAEQWQAKLGNVNVLALDLFDGKVATTPEEAQKLVTTANPSRIMAILQGAVDYAGADARIATLGWCYGGGYALQTSILAGPHGAATVMYYGMPELDTAKLALLNGPVIEFFGSQDKFINAQKQADFKKAMKEAHRSLETHTYNAVHAFANPSNPKYDKTAAKDANERAFAFLKKTFMLP